MSSSTSTSAPAALATPSQDSTDPLTSAFGTLSVTPGPTNTYATDQEADAERTRRHAAHDKDYLAYKKTIEGYRSIANYLAGENWRWNRLRRTYDKGIRKAERRIEEGKAESARLDDVFKYRLTQKFVWEERCEKLEKELNEAHRRIEKNRAKHVDLNKWQEGFNAGAMGQKLRAVEASKEVMKEWEDFFSLRSDEVPAPLPEIL